MKFSFRCTFFFPTTLIIILTSTTNGFLPGVNLIQQPFWMHNAKPSSSSSSHHHHHQSTWNGNPRRKLNLYNNNNNNNNNEDEEDNTSISSSFNSNSLLTLLRKLDEKQQQQQQQSQVTRINRGPNWKKLTLPTENNNDSSSLPFVHLLEPKSTSNPSSIIIFVGGAILGQFPHISYSECLYRISQKLGATILAIPYTMINTFDHFELSRGVWKMIRLAIQELQDGNADVVDCHYDEDLVVLPKFVLGHSLGGKLNAIALSAIMMMDDNNQKEEMVEDVMGVGMISFNNFAFRDTVRMGRSFAKDVIMDQDDRQEDEYDDDDEDDENQFAGFGNNNNNNWINTILDFAQQAVDMIGLEFTPSPSDTERIIEMRYSTNDKLLNKTRMFVLDDDQYDSSRSFVECCQRQNTESNNNVGPSISGLPGSHLTPVYLKFDVEDAVSSSSSDQTMDPMIVNFVREEAFGGLRSVSYGSEEDLNGLVDEICNWILGKEAKRGWKEGEEKRLLSGS